MKHYNSIGMAIGAALGIALSLYKDKNGNRPCPELRDQLQGIRSDAEDISIATNNLKAASRKLQGNLPRVKKSISDMQNAIRYYQVSTSYARKRLKTKINELNNQHIVINKKLGNNSKK